MISIPGWVIISGAIIGPFLFWMACALEGDWHDRIEDDSWLADYAKQERLSWLKAGFVAMLLCMILAIVSP